LASLDQISIIHLLERARQDNFLSAGSLSGIQKILLPIS
jgi:hypothetical protein